VKLNPYLSFDGNAAEAFAFYAQTFGGKIVFIQSIGDSPMAASVPKEAHGRVMHATLYIGDLVLMGADGPLGSHKAPTGFCVALHVDTIDEAQRIFAALSDQGSVQMPFGPTFWAAAFGMCTDRFGTPWSINVPANK